VKRSLLALVLCLAASPAALGNVPDLFGVGSRAIARGGAFTAVADDFSAVYYNPAGLTQHEGATFTLAPTLVSADLWLRDPGLPAESVRLPSAHGVHAGVVAPIGRLVDLEGLWFGLSLYAPYSFVLDAEVPPRADTRYLPVFHDAWRRVSATVAVAYDIAGVVSVGLGIDLFMDLGGRNVIKVGSREHQWNEDEQVEIDLIRELTMDPALFAGVHATLTDWLRVGVSYRMEERADTSFDPNDVRLGNFDVDMELKLANFYRPHQITLGVALAPHPLIDVSLDAALQLWSGYLDPHARRPDPAFSDVVVPRVGVAVSPTDWLGASAGYFFHATPVPDQTGETNLVDSDRHGLSAGLSLDLRGLCVPLTLEAHLQVQLLSERTTTKDLAQIPDADPETAGLQIVNEGYPTFTAGGTLLSGGLTLTYFFP